eukprot:scaffold8005_cov275-Amphora_coffeaeformis.AAC.15
MVASQESSLVERYHHVQRFLRWRAQHGGAWWRVTSVVYFRRRKPSYVWMGKEQHDRTLRNRDEGKSSSSS